MHFFRMVKTEKNTSVNKLEVYDSSGLWYVGGLPPYRIDDEGDWYTSCGPYDTRAEAENARVGMGRFFRLSRKDNYNEKNM